MQEYETLSEDEMNLLASIAKDLKAKGPEKESDFTRYENLTYHGKGKRSLGFPGRACVCNVMVKAVSAA